MREGQEERGQGVVLLPRSLNSSVRPKRWKNYPSTGEGTILHHNRSKGEKINTSTHSTVHVLAGKRRNFHSL